MQWFGWPTQPGWSHDESDEESPSNPEDEKPRKRRLLPRFLPARKQGPAKPGKATALPETTPPPPIVVAPLPEKVTTASLAATEDVDLPTTGTGLSESDAGNQPGIDTLVPVPIPISGTHIAYTWQDSDSLKRIAELADSSPDAILRLNKLDRSRLREGQVLRIPRGGQLEQFPSPGLPSSFSPEQQASREIWRGIRGRKQIALTFDAGADPDFADLLLDNLRETATRATFFATGQFAREHRPLLKKIHEAGHPIYNHSWSHPEFTRIEDAAMVEELRRADTAIQEITGQTTLPYWRPPFGDRDGRVLRVTAAAGYRSIYWTLDSLDSVDDPKSAEFILDRVLHPPKAGGDPADFLDGAIILMHVGKRGTAEAVPALVRELRAQGFSFVTLDQILAP